MMVKVFQSNANGKIEFTRAELEKLLNEVFKKGYDSGVSDTKQNYWTWTSPTVNLRTPDSVQLCGINDVHTSTNLAKCVDDIVNSLSSGGPYTPKTSVISNERAEASTPHAKLARELMNL